MWASALWTVFPCGSTTAFFGVMTIFAFMSLRAYPRKNQAECWGKSPDRASHFCNPVVKHSKAESFVRAKAERVKGVSEGAHFEEESGFVCWVGFLSQDGDAAI